MAECPQCHSSIDIPEQNFGTLFTCPLCFAVYFVGWEGIPESPSTEVVLSPSSSQPPVAIENNLKEAPLAWDQLLGQNVEELASRVEPLTEVSTDEVTMNEVTDFQDVVEFGNSPQLEGSLTYTIFIKGIDIADTREKIKEALNPPVTG